MRKTIIVLVSSLSTVLVTLSMSVYAQSSDSTISKSQLLNTIKTAVINIKTVDALQAQMLKFKSPQQKAKHKKRREQELIQAAACMGISARHLFRTEKRIKSDRNKMLTSIDQCSVYLPETISTGNAGNAQTKPFSSCLYGFGAKELGVSQEVAEQCRYGERLVRRYQF